MGIETVIIAVVSAATSLYTSSQSGSAADKARRQQRAMYGQEQAALEQARLDEIERQKAEEERLKPWREAQTSALEKYRQMAENPELSELTQLRLEEEEKAINKELAAKGMLFSGPAAELKQKARTRIIAEETENAKRMLENVMGAAPPEPGMMPGTAQYDAMIASLQPKSMGTTGAEARGQGMYEATSSLISGATGYYKGKAYEDYLKRTEGLMPQSGQTYSNPYGLMPYEYGAMDIHSPYYAYGGGL